MSDEVQFDEEASIVRPTALYSAPVATAPRGSGAIITWLMAKGWVKTPMQANIALVVVALLCFGITAWMLSGVARPAALEPQVLRMNEWMKAGGTGQPSSNFMPGLQ